MTKPREKNKQQICILFIQIKGTRLNSTHIRKKYRVSQKTVNECKEEKEVHISNKEHDKYDKKS